jgi:hypothetical protein
VCVCFFSFHELLNQILCVFLILLMCATCPSYLRTIFALYTELCLSCLCAVNIDIMCFWRRKIHVMWWVVLSQLCTEKVNVQEGALKTTVTEETDVAREVRLRQCVHWIVATAVQYQNVSK